MSRQSSARSPEAGSVRPAADGPVTIEPVRTRAGRRRFIRSAWPIYEHDPNWVPPLISDVRNALDPRKHPFHRHADVELFTASRGGRTAGRIAAIINHAHNEFHDDRVGFFGLFESVDDMSVAAALLRHAESWLERQGMDVVRGPMNLSTNDELWGPGVLIEGFERPPAVMMGHSPPYYADLLEAAGYTKSRDLLAYWIDPSRERRVWRSADRLIERNRIRIRPLDLRRLNDEVAIIREIYNAAWERNWGFVPMTDAEINHLASQLRPVVNPELCAIAYVADEPAGFALALPDYNQVLRRLNGRLLPFGILKLLWYRRSIDAARTLTLGVKPQFRHKGLDGLMIMSLFQAGAAIGIRSGECSWILEDNAPMRHVLERMNARAYKTYRVFEKRIR